MRRLSAAAVAVSLAFCLATGRADAGYSGGYSSGFRSSGSYTSSYRSSGGYSSGYRSSGGYSSGMSRSFSSGTRTGSGGGIFRGSAAGSLSRPSGGFQKSTPGVSKLGSAPTFSRPGGGFLNIHSAASSGGNGKAVVSKANASSLSRPTYPSQVITATVTRRTVSGQASTRTFRFNSDLRSGGSPSLYRARAPLADVRSVRAVQPVRVPYRTTTHVVVYQPWYPFAPYYGFYGYNPSLFWMWFVIDSSYSSGYDRGYDNGHQASSSGTAPGAVPQPASSAAPLNQPMPLPTDSKTPDSITPADYAPPASNDPSYDPARTGMQPVPTATKSGAKS